MSRRLITALTLALLAVSALTGTVLAATLTPFMAQGTLDQQSTNPSVVTTVAAAQPYVPAGLYNTVLGIVGPATPGNLTTSQVFTGSIDVTDWDDLEDADVTVNQNSWFTADVASLFPPTNAPFVPGIGLAWGTLTAGEDDDSVTAGYAAVIQGAVFINPACFNPATNPYALALDITDNGGWAVLDTDGDLRAINPAGGALSVHATGCLYDESATFAISGSYTDGDRGEDSRSDKGRENGKDDERKSDGKGDSKRSDRGYERGRDRD
jgi:hypothetical protein